MENFAKKIAFTLAEVIIVVGIVGIIAEMTIPTVIGDIQAQSLRAAFNKSYSNLTAAVQRTIYDDYGGSLVISSASDFIVFMNNLQKHYIKSIGCTTTQICPGDAIFPLEKFGSSEAGVFMSSNYKTYTKSGASSSFNDGIIALADGGFIFYDYSEASEATSGMYFLAIDVNGWRKKPNRFGHDFFTFQLSNNGKILPMGAENTFYSQGVYCSKTSTHGCNGYGCTSKALVESDYFNNLPK